MQVSIIIVNYNTYELLKNCLNSIFFNTKDINFEVIVSDNASSDNSISMLKNNFPSVKIIENRKNLGFAAANNRAISIAKGELILYLNSDTILLNNALKLFYDFWKQNDFSFNLGAIGCVLFNQNKIPAHSYGNFPSLYASFLEYSLLLKIVKKIFCLNKEKIKYPVIEPFKVDYICGAALFLKNSESAYFDEQYFLYYEDADLQYKLAKSNKNRYIIPGPEIKHFQGGSDKPKNKLTQDGSFSNIQCSISMIKYHKKHNPNYFLINILKIIIILKWLNPFIINKTYKFIPQLLET